MTHTHTVARELAPAGLRSNPKSIDRPILIDRSGLPGGASHPNGSKLPRHIGLYGDVETQHFAIAQLPVEEV